MKPERDFPTSSKRLRLACVYGEMVVSVVAMNSTDFSFRHRLLRRTFAGVTLAALAVAAHAQTKPNKIERRDMKRDASDAPTGKVTSENAQSRVLAKLREQFEVTDDAEWNLIAERITNVSELRRTVAG